MHYINMVTGQIYSKMYAFWRPYFMDSVISFSERICLGDEAEISSQLPELLQV